MPPTIPARTRSTRVRSALSAHGTKVHAAHLDVRDSDLTNRFVAEAEAAIGPADILVNAAGTTAEQPVCGHSDALWNKIVDTNLTGAFRATRAVLPGMIGRGWGRIVNIGSTAASVGWKDNPAYCASKAGLLGLTRCVALEGAAHGVTCVMISPTWVETELMRRNVAQVVEREGKGRTARGSDGRDRQEAIRSSACCSRRKSPLWPSSFARTSPRASPWKTYRSPAELCGSVGAGWLRPSWEEAGIRVRKSPTDRGTEMKRKCLERRRHRAGAPACRNDCRPNRRSRRQGRADQARHAGMDGPACLHPYRRPASGEARLQGRIRHRRQFPAVLRPRRRLAVAPRSRSG